MDVHLVEELLNELGSSLENLETQQEALLQFLRDKGIVTEEQFVPYLTQAGNASTVRWRAARLRLDHIVSAAQREHAGKAAEHQTAEAQSRPPTEKESMEAKSGKKAGEKPAAEQRENEDRGTAETKPAPEANREKTISEQSQPSPRESATDENAA